MINIDALLQDTIQLGKDIDGGRLATYIPELAKTNPDLFAVSMCDVHDQSYGAGDFSHKFTLQSVSKIFTYALALENFSEDEIEAKVGLEPTGEVFDSIIELDKYQRPFNPMINSGAIAVIDLLITRFGSQALGESLKYFSRFMGDANLQVNEAVYRSELATGERNRALAHLLKSFAILENPVEEVLQLYFQHCSIEVTTQQLAQMGATIARNGANSQGEQCLKPVNVQRLLSVMLSCGMYNYAGQWIYEVGLPAKSGVSGAILAIAPKQYGIAVYSPLINADGCSQKGDFAIKKICSTLKLHLFALSEPQ